ncbi:MAG: uroporphyrinogen-III C-methyltransferase [Thermoleophilia bacterium]|nr:uroporphyrinogen-III C-methyltransferase [Thermoleophilia bacterium]
MVYLVGAGPGDPGLITVRGREALMRADVVLFDRLGTEALLHLCRPDAQLVDVGKAPGRQAMSQDETTALLIAMGEAGKVTVRLKGGDPFVFGRGAEEAEALIRAGIRVVVVPGITSAIGAPSAAGIPVTYRAMATAFTVVTGHEDPTKDAEQTDWEALARTPGTLVVLMGMTRLAGITERLIRAGRPADQPAAVVQWGTTPRQRTVIATLATLADRAQAEGVDNPAVVVIGDVVSRAPALAAAVRGPLAGRTIVVTRARAQASDLRTTLEMLGAHVIELPVIRIAPIIGSPDIMACLGQIGGYDIIVFTSANGVHQLAARLAERGLDARSLRPDQVIVAVGSATAEALTEYAIRADIVPERFVAEGVLDALATLPMKGRRVLVARAREGRTALVEGLRARGGEVDEVALYATVAEAPPGDALDAALAADLITFTSSSTVTNTLALFDDTGRARLIAGPRVVSIGPITSQTAREAGLIVAIEAHPHDIPGLVQAILDDA